MPEPVGKRIDLEEIRRVMELLENGVTVEDLKALLEQYDKGVHLITEGQQLQGRAHYALKILDRPKLNQPEPLSGERA